MGNPSLSAPPSSEGARGVSEGTGGFIENFKVRVGLKVHKYCAIHEYYFPSKSPSLESHQSAESLFRDSWGDQKDEWQCVTEAEGKKSHWEQSVCLNKYLLEGLS